MQLHAVPAVSAACTPADSRRSGSLRSKNQGWSVAGCTWNSTSTPPAGSPAASAASSRSARSAISTSTVGSGPVGFTTAASCFSSPASCSSAATPAADASAASAAAAASESAASAVLSAGLSGASSAFADPAAALPPAAGALAGGDAFRVAASSAAVRACSRASEGTYQGCMTRPSGHSLAASSKQQQSCSFMASVMLPTAGVSDSGRHTDRSLWMLHVVKGSYRRQ